MDPVIDKSLHAIHNRTDNVIETYKQIWSYIQSHFTVPSLVKWFGRPHLKMYNLLRLLTLIS